mmetsp:Transcript_858/g.2113  ORF Transcript_858/g.2113 Transcript_858/m.2113 type:complete len:91 (-) Transcript_858:469-741(-)
MVCGLSLTETPLGVPPAITVAALLAPLRARRFDSFRRSSSRAPSGVSLAAREDPDEEGGSEGVAGAATDIVGLFHHDPNSNALREPSSIM